MASALETAKFFEDTRKTRSSVFHQMAPPRPNLSLGSTFAVGKNAWNGNPSIWSSASQQKDGVVDENVVRDAQSFDQLYVPGKAGSRSILSPTESEMSASRAPNPWATSLRTNMSTVSRSQNQPISPLRPHNGNIVSVSHDRKQLNARQNPFEAGEKGDLNMVKPIPISQQTFNSSGRHFEKSAFAEFIPLYSDNHGHQPTDDAVFESNPFSHRSFRRPSKPEAQDHRSAERSSLSPMTFEPLGNDFPRDVHSEPRSSASDAFSNRQANQFANGFNRGSGSSYILPQSARWDKEVRQAGDDYQMLSALNRLSIAEDDYISESNDLKVPPYQSVSGRRADPQYNFLRTTNKPPPAHAFDEGNPTSSRASNLGSFQDHSYQPLSAFGRNASFYEPALSPSATNGFRPGLSSSFYPASISLPTESGSMRGTANSGVSSGTPNDQLNLYERKLNLGNRFQQDLQPPHPNSTQLPYSFRHPPNFDYSGYPGPMRMNPLASPYTTQNYGSAAGPFDISGYVNPEPDASQIIRSPLLEDFRVNSKTNKRYELKDIYNHVVEFSGDQHGSRFIQQKLETANSDEKDQIFAEIQPNSLQLMTDVFGNYVIQKLFAHGNQSQKKVLANQMKGHVLSLSTQMYACRVVQKALEHILTDQQASMVKELESHVLKCVKDQNGNHVIQKAIERVPAEHIQFIINAFTDQVQRLATHPYGCRVIQRMLEHCEESSRQSILCELHACVPSLITDQYGNYVIQHVIENGDAEDRRRIVSIVQVQVLHFSKHKFASNVVEKSLEFADEGQRREMLAQLTATNERGEGPVLGLMRDQYGNYVLQKVLAHLHGQQRQDLVDQIRTNLVPLKKLSCGKQIMAIEKLIGEPHMPGSFAPTAPRQQMSQGQPMHDGAPSTMNRDYQAPSLSVSSESSALPSTTASTADGPATPPQSANHKSSYPHTIKIALPLPPTQPRYQ